MSIEKVYIEGLGWISAEPQRLIDFPNEEEHPIWDLPEEDFHNPLVNEENFYDDWEEA